MDLIIISKDAYIYITIVAMIVLHYGFVDSAIYFLVAAICLRCIYDREQYSSGIRQDSQIEILQQEVAALKAKLESSTSEISRDSSAIDQASKD